MRLILSLALSAPALLAPIAASAALIDPALVPDGSYVVKVEKIQDAQHVLVAMQNGMETTLIPEHGNFSSVKANDTMKITLVQGKVHVYHVQ